jgi:ElaB/YqjD/DUF883 family membrane-anchored ribosome-binding protein
MNPNKMKEQAGEIQDEAEETAQSLKERAMQWKEAATDRVTNMAKTTDNYVHDNPWPAITATAVFAFALGLLIGSRRR